MRQDLALLRDHRFGLLFVARTASVLGSAFGPVALAFGVLALPGASAATLSVVTATQAASMVAFTLAGGLIADRFPRYRVMVVADLVAAAAWGGLATMLILHWAPMWLVLLLAAVSGMAAGLFFPAATAVVPEIVLDTSLQAANGILRLGMNGARIAGLAVAGVAVAGFGAGWATAVNAVLLVVSALLVMGLRPVNKRVKEVPAPIGALPVSEGSVVPLDVPATVAASSPSLVRDLREGWDEFRSRQWLWVVVLQYSFVMMVFQAVWGVLGPIVANERMGGAKVWSWILAAEAAGMLVGVVFAIRAKPRRPIRLVVLLAFPLASVPLMLAIQAPIYLTVLAAFVGGIALDVLVVMWDTTMQREIPRESLSRVSSYDILGTFMLGPVGLLLAGASAAVVGVSGALLICAAVTVLVSAAALCSPGVRKLEWSSQPVGELPAFPDRDGPGSPSRSRPDLVEA